MLNEILKCIGLDENAETLGFKCTVMGKNGVYIEGVKKIAAFGEDEILLKVQASLIRIQGLRLSIKNMTSSDVVVSGEIVKVLFERDKVYE